MLNTEGDRKVRGSTPLLSSNKNEENYMNKSLIIQELIYGIVGISLVVYYTHWQVGVGLFLLLWSNNIGARIRELRKNES